MGGLFTNVPYVLYYCYREVREARCAIQLDGFVASLLTMTIQILTDVGSENFPFRPDVIAPCPLA